MRRTILTVALIDKAIKDLTPGNRCEIWDAMVPGLSLGIGALRSTWSLRLKHPGLPRSKIRLGYYPLLTLAQARREALQRRMDALAAIPLPEKNTPSQRPLLAPQESPVSTLTLLLNIYQKITEENGKPWATERRRIEIVFQGELETKLSALTTVDLQKCVDEYPAKSTAGHALGLAKPMLKYAAKRGWVNFDCTKIDPPKGIIKRRDRFLSSDELRAILPVLTFEGYDGAMRLLMLTACRREEVAQAAWDEFELVDGQSTWTIPGSRRKNGKPMQIPLPRQAVEALRALGGVMSGPVYPEFVNWDGYQKKLFKRTGTSGWHRHDLRRTAATILGGLGVLPHVIEACLGHATLHSSLAGIYNQSRYTNEHAEALQGLADYYDKLLA